MIVMMRPPSYLFKFLALSQLLLLLGLLVHLALPPLIERFIDKQIALTPKSRTYPMWREPPVPIHQRFYFYNVTNAQDIESRGAKPQLEEIGPFTYRSEWSKRDIEWDKGQRVINFKHVKQWIFEPELSVEDEQLQLVTLNAPLAITLSLIQSASNAVRLLVTFSLDGLSEGFFTKRTVRQLLFEGYPDLLTTFGPLLNAEMLSQGGHFGYMNARNNNLDATYEINTGLDDISKLNTINKFNGKPELPYWYTNNRHHKETPQAAAAANQCNSLEGATTGEMFPPVMGDHQTSVKLFQPDLCRVWRLDYDSKFEHPSGLRLKRFLASRDIFRNSTDLPENSCYFKRSRQQHDNQVQQNNNRIPSGANLNPQAAAAAAAAAGQQRQARQQSQGGGSGGGGGGRPPSAGGHHHSRVRQEWPAGVFTLGPCKFNAPIYVSMPHFLDADPHYQAQVQGLEPDRDRHEFYLDLEPRTGSPVHMAARVQLNVAISKPPGLVRFRNIPEIMFPVFWQELAVNVSSNEQVIEQLLVASRRTQEAIERISYVLLILSGLILTTCALFYLHHLTQNRHFFLGGQASSAAAKGAKIEPGDLSQAAISHITTTTATSAPTTK